MSNRIKADKTLFAVNIVTTGKNKGKVNINIIDILPDNDKKILLGILNDLSSTLIIKLQNNKGKIITDPSIILGANNGISI